MTHFDWVLWRDTFIEHDASLHRSTQGYLHPKNNQALTAKVRLNDWALWIQKQWWPGTISSRTPWTKSSSSSIPKSIQNLLVISEERLQANISFYLKTRIGLLHGMVPNLNFQCQSKMSSDMRSTNPGRQKVNANFHYHHTLSYLFIDITIFLGFRKHNRMSWSLERLQGWKVW